MGGWFQHTATRRWLATLEKTHHTFKIVSTHSHPKVAGLPTAMFWPLRTFQHTATRRWLDTKNGRLLFCKCFNTQPPEGGWCAAAKSKAKRKCFNTQPPEGGWSAHSDHSASGNSFNTQPPEGGWSSALCLSCCKAGFNTQPPEGGWVMTLEPVPLVRVFQHTATRRWLAAERCADFG